MRKEVTVPISYAERERRRNPVLYEQVRLVMDAVADLKLAMEDLGISQSDLARRLGRSRGIVSRQLRGHENLSLGKLAELAHALGKRFELKLSDVPASSRKTASVQVPWQRESQVRSLHIASPIASSDGVDHIAA
jgi:transcriptional regulator with XRE-family HTH domain